MKTKNKILLFLSTAFVACATLAVAMPSVVGMAADDAATESSTETPAYGFYMEDGAAVRVSTAASQECTGIRYTTNITEDYYTNTLKANYANATSITLTTEIAPAADSSNPRIYTWDITNGMSYEDGVSTFYAALDYSDLTETQRIQAIAMELKATSYITVTQADATTVTIATETCDQEDTVRSMRAVAVAALYDDETSETAKSALREYLGTNKTSESEATVYIETSETNGLGDYTAAYLNTRKIAQDSIGGAALSGLELGEKGELVLFDDENNYKIVPFQYVTKAIEDYTDLQSLLITTELVNATVKTIDGYYALTKNLDFLGDEYSTFHHAGLESASGLHSNGTEYGLIGTFDGNGYTLSVKLGWYGLFGKIGAGATIKNLVLNAQFEKGSTYTSRGTSVFAYKSTATTSNRVSVENIWIHIVADNSTGKANPCVIFVNSNYIGWKNFVVSYDSEKITYELAKNGGIFCVNDTVSYSGTFTNNTSNCYIISSEKIALTNLTGSKAYTYYGNTAAIVNGEEKTCYQNFSYISTLADATNLAWTYDATSGRLTVK